MVFHFFILHFITGANHPVKMIKLNQSSITTTANVELSHGGRRRSQRRGAQDGGRHYILLKKALHRPVQNTFQYNYILQQTSIYSFEAKFLHMIIIHRNLKELRRVFPLPLGVWEGLRFVIVALPGLFSYLFLFLLCPIVKLDLGPKIY